MDDDDFVTAYDQNDNRLMCSCGKKAVGGVTAVNYSAFYCKDCMSKKVFSNNGYVAPLIYKPELRDENES